MSAAGSSPSRPPKALRRYHRPLRGSIRALVRLPPKVYMAEGPNLAGEGMRALLEVVLLVLHLYWWVIIASAIFSWLYAFGVVNPRNQVVAMIGRTLYQLTEPALRPIRRFVPVFGGLDITPIILLLILFLIERIILLYVYPYVF